MQHELAWSSVGATQMLAQGDQYTYLLHPTKATAVYRGMTPLTGQDIGECIAWVATRPSHVNIDEMVIRPRDQATATMVHRQGDD